MVTGDEVKTIFFHTCSVPTCVSFVEREMLHIVAEYEWFEERLKLEILFGSKIQLARSGS